MASEPTPFQFVDPTWPGLAKLAEECGEVVQVIAKIIGTGGTMRFRDGQAIDRSRLVEEMADLYAALDFVDRHALHADERIDRSNRYRAKSALFEQWRREEAEAHG